MKKSTFRIVLCAMALAITALAFPASAQNNVAFTKENFPQQKKELRKALRLIKKGDKCFAFRLKGKYSEALDYYLEANNFNPNNALLNYKIGVSYIETYYKNNALIYLENARKLDPAVMPDIDYYLGKALQYNMRFDQATEAYNNFKNQITAKDPEWVTAEVDKRIQECQYGQEFVQNRKRVKVSNLGGDINSMWDDYCPVVSANDSILAFTTRRKGSHGDKLNKYDYLYYENILFTYKDETNEWGIPVDPGKPINQKRNDATSDISADGKTLTIYKNKGGQQFLYETRLSGSVWSKPVKLSKEINKRNAHQSSSTYTSDGNTIYFTSEQKDGFGGLDIYVSNKNADGVWEPARNLGKVLNTPFDEDAVFLFNDSILYFSSRGHNSMGDYDIFFSKLGADGNWIEPVNMGLPLNSPGTDIFLFFNGRGNAYYSSDRQGGAGGLDIYYVRYTMTHDELIAGLNPVDIRSQFVDETTSEAVLASVEVKDVDASRMVARESTDSTGVFDLSLSSGKEYQMSVFMTECDVNLLKPVRSGFGTHYEPAWLPANVKNDTLPATLIQGTVLDQKTLMPVQPAIEILNSTTGAKVATVIPDTNGNYSVSLPSCLEYKFVYMTTGCEHKRVVAQTNQINYSTSDVDGSQIKLENIYFDYDRSSIRADAIEILNRHAELFNQHKNWKIMIDGHTDNMGSLKYNIFLSKERALSAIDYLVKKGVKRNRFRFHAYGYEKPVVPNETPEGRQLNRRVEFRIID